MPSSVLTWLQWQRTALFIVVLVLFAVRGARRETRIGIALLLADSLLVTLLVEGPRAAMIRLLFVATVTTALMFLGLRSWRTPRRIQYSPFVGTTEAWPSHAVKDIERWTAELVALGFERPTDVCYAWSVMGTNRTTYLRLLAHRQEGMWACLYALGAPKGIGRSINSHLAGGRWLQTADRLSDVTMVPLPEFVTQSISGASCDRLVERHRTALRTLGATPPQVEDPVTEHRSARDAWIEGLLKSNAALVDGGDVRLAPGAIPAAIGRRFAHWFT